MTLIEFMFHIFICSTEVVSYRRRTRTRRKTCIAVADPENHIKGRPYGPHPKQFLINTFLCTQLHTKIHYFDFFPNSLRDPPPEALGSAYAIVNVGSYWVKENIAYSIIKHQNNVFLTKYL